MLMEKTKLLVLLFWDLGNSSCLIPTVKIYLRLISEILGSYIKSALAMTTLERIPAGTWSKSDLKE
ncbi:hypothetical protein DV515_00000265 [Chloebia gouldiae]|uniref:Uncharacterized protein n=1 Tax=Chloebia gouldiae TaxID=44316 RepID=A0A3L8T2R0_CHLGU|nr:hypothetical protein DV515_00000265 [Chloebia gouldiae]